MSSDAGLGDVANAELTFLRALLLGLFSWDSTEENADAAGLSISEAAEAERSLARRGVISLSPQAWPSPNFEHETGRLFAARASATPISWARARNAPRDPREVRANIDDHAPLWGRMREDRARRFGGLEGDARRAAVLLVSGVSGFSLSRWSSYLVDAAYLFDPPAWSLAAESFAHGSLRRTICLSLAEDRAFPGLPPMLIVDRSRTNCSVCGSSALWSEGRRHVTVPGVETPRELGCGCLWTHYTIRPWLAELGGWVRTDGAVTKRMPPLEEPPDLEWLDP
jgi:hypothetical protein